MAITADTLRQIVVVLRVEAARNIRHSVVTARAVGTQHGAKRAAAGHARGRQRRCGPDECYYTLSVR